VGIETGNKVASPVSSALTPSGHSSFHKFSAVAEMGDPLATTDMGRKLGGAVPLFGGAEHNVAWDEAYLHDTNCHLDPSNRFATIDMGRKLGLCPLLWGGENCSFLGRE